MSEFPINLDRLKECLLIYGNVSGVSISAIDNNGHVIYRVGKSFNYCSKFHKTINTNHVCNKFHIEAAQKSFQVGEALMLFCPGGLVQWITPIVVENSMIGALIGGPALLIQADDFIFDELKENFNLKENNISVLKKEILDIPVINTKIARYYVELLDIIAGSLSSEGNKIMIEKKEFFKVQAKLSEAIQDIKDESDQITEYYPYEKEKQLMNMVRMGDSIGAKTILNELLGHVFFKSGANFEYIKARALELTVMLSRSAVEAGANLEMMFGFNYMYLNEIGSIGDVNDLSFWLIKVLDKFMEVVSKDNISDKGTVIKDAIEFIKRRYKSNITLEDVAEIVYLSPNYFSKLFKDKVGMNFSDYLNKVRVDESKKFLLHHDMNILEVALNSGFSDQSYYTRVFKNFEGITPGQWRKMN